MNKYIIIMLSLNIPLHCMEPQQKQITQRSPREWPAESYDAGNTMQTNAFLQALEQYKINLSNRAILDVGCGTGKITALLASNNTYVHGIDASKNMIDFARNKYDHIKNLSFEHCFAEDFIPQKQYELVLASFCIHWFEDKKKAFQHISDTLAIGGGEFFATLKTKENPPALSLIVAEEMIPTFKAIIGCLTKKRLFELIGSTFPTCEEYNTMITEAGFEIISNKEETFKYKGNAQDIRKTQWPIFSSRPGIQWLPTTAQEYLFDKFMELYLEKITKTDDGMFIDTIVTNIIHARKKSDIEDIIAQLQDFINQ